MAPSAKRTIVRGDFQPTLEEALVGRVVAEKRRDPLASIRIVVPSNLLRVHLRRRLAESVAFVGVRIDSLRGLIEEIAFPEVARRELTPMPSLAATIFAEAAIAAMPRDSTFDPLRAMPGFPGRLASTIRDLRDAAITPEALAAAADSKKLNDLAALYSDFEARRVAAKLPDDAGLCALATARVKEGVGLGDDTTLFVYGFYDFVTVQQRFVEALLEEHGGVVFSPVPDGDAGEFGKPFLERLAAQGFVTEEPSPKSNRAPESDLALLRARLAGELPRDGASIRNDGSVRFLSPRFRGEEPREMLRVVRDLVERGVGLHEIGIVYRQRGGVRLVAAEVTRIERELPGVSLPLFEQGGHALSETSAARALIRFADALRSKLGRNEVLAFLDASGCSTRTPAWARIARRASIVGGNGVAEWDDALVLIGKAKRTRPRYDADEEGADAQRAIDVRARDAEELRRRVASLGTTLRALETADTYGAAAAALRDGFSAICGEDAALGIARALDALADADLAKADYDIETFLDLVEEAIRSASTRAGSFEKGLLAGGLLGVRGLSFRVVILPSLEEGVFPRRAAQDPLFLDEERRKVSSEAAVRGEPGLPRATDRSAAEERLLFHFACHAARETLVLSCPRFEDASDKEIAPSSLWRGALEALFGAPLPKGDVRRIESLRGLFSSSGAVLDLSEWDRATVARAVAARDGARARFLAELDPVAAQALVGEVTRRRSKHFTEYDGILGGKDWAKRAKRLLSEPLAVTRVERFAMCPFKFFAGSVLEIDPNDPRKEGEIGFREHGDVLHEAAEHFFYKLEKRDETWPLDPSRKEVLRGELLEIGRAVFEQYAKATRLPSVVLDAARLALDDDLTMLLEYEYLSPRAERPRHFETTFGGDDAPPIEIGKGASGLRFLGAIDRIDVDPNGKTAIVVDYKTGKKPDRKNIAAGLDGGRALQLPIYALAAQRALGRSASVESAEYFYCTRRGEGLRFGPTRTEFEGEGLVQLEETVSELARNLRAGHFFADPSVEKICDFCELKLACGKGPFLEAGYERKKADPAVNSFQKQRGALEADADVEEGES